MKNSELSTRLTAKILLIKNKPEVLLENSLKKQKNFINSYGFLRLSSGNEHG